MARSKIEVVNIRNSSNGIYQVDFLPYSVSTLKLRVTNTSYRNIDVFIRPLNHEQSDEYCGGYDDLNNGIKILWGGGEEEGNKISLGVNESKFSYFFVYHYRYSIASYYRLTLEIKDVLRTSIKKPEIYQVMIILYPLTFSNKLLKRIITNKQKMNIC